MSSTEPLSSVVLDGAFQKLVTENEMEEMAVELDLIHLFLHWLFLTLFLYGIKSLIYRI